MYVHEKCQKWIKVAFFKTKVFFFFQFKKKKKSKMVKSDKFIMDPLLVIYVSLGNMTQYFFISF